MLILHRDTGQSIRIGDSTVTVVAIRIREPGTGRLLSKPHVLLGIESPAGTRIVRTELEDYAKGKTWSFGRV